MDDLISRQAVLEATSAKLKITGKENAETVYGYIKKLCDDIKALPSAQQWIPCSERLPEEDGDYLVCYEGGYREDYGFPKIGIAPFEVDCEGFGIWQEEFDLQTLGSLGSEWVVIPVDAWMSLPDPYEVKSNG